MKTAGTVFQTYRQEVADHFNELDEDNRRLVVRGDIKQWNQMLAETAHNAGVITNEEFAIFQNAGYMGSPSSNDPARCSSERRTLTVSQPEKILPPIYSSILLLTDHLHAAATRNKNRIGDIVSADKILPAAAVTGGTVQRDQCRFGGSHHDLKSTGKMHAPRG